MPNNKNIKYKIENILDKILCGDVVTELKKIPDESIDTVITSPPYFGLRSYDSLYNKEFSNKEKAKKWILKKEKENKDYFSKIRNIFDMNNKIVGYKAIIYSKFIKKNQVGLEETTQDYINRMVEIAKEVKRVLKKTGSFWLNIGDSYNVKMGKYPTKCLLQIPQRIAIALTDKLGFILRNDIIWSKQVLIHKKNSTIGNVMPSSVKDRLNNSYEHLFFFTKNKKYYFDIDSIRIPHQTQSLERYQRAVNLGAIQVQGKIFEDKVDKPMQPPKVFREKFGKDKNYKGKFSGTGKESENYGSPRARNERISKVPSANTGFFNKEPYKKNNPHRSRLEREGLVPGNTSQARTEHDVRDLKKKNNENNEVDNNIQGKNIPDTWCVNTRPSSIKHFALFPKELLMRPIKTCLPKKGIVLDPFFGGGTTAIAQRLYKPLASFIGIEINKSYIEIAEKRIKEETPEGLGI